jgi:DNA (cytosine-5)-methyltransferase 1
MNYLSVCSGIEAASVAWHPLGWNCLGVSEIEPFPCAVLNHHYPNVPNFGDMTKFKEWKINGTVDLLVGGTPCASFSVAGLRQGLKDPRGNLMLTFLAIAEHFKRPKWILWENVPGVLSSNGGKDFGSFLGGLGELGYGFAYRVLDAQWCRTHRHPRAVPQRRRRVFVVGCLRDFTSAAKVLFERESLSRYSAPRRATRQRTADNVEEGVGGAGKIVADVATVDARNNFGAVLQPVATPMLFENHPQDSRVTGPHDVAPSCVSQYGTGGGNVPIVIPIMPQAMQAEGWRVGKENQDGRGNGLGVGKDGDPCTTLDRSAVHAVATTKPTMQVRRLTPTECERLQGFPDGWTAIPWKKKPADQCPDGPRYKALGNSMAVNCMEWLGERIQAVESGTL